MTAGPASPPDPAPASSFGAAAPLLPQSRRRALLADAALLTVAIAWGFNFVVIKDAIGATGPMTYLLWRRWRP